MLLGTCEILGTLLGESELLGPSFGIGDVLGVMLGILGELYGVRMNVTFWPSSTTVTVATFVLAQEFW